MDKKSYREVLGKRLKTFRESRGLTAYAVAKKGSIAISQVKDIETGSTNYTIDILIGYIVGSELSEQDFINIFKRYL